jgi:hypothetical protein
VRSQIARIEFTGSRVYMFGMRPTLFLILASLLLAPLAVCAGPAAMQLTAERRDAVLATWHALTPPEVEAKKIDALPKDLAVERIDVSEKIRSASFGHTTTLLVPTGGKEFYVEYGRSTNRPAALYGPFSVRGK